MLNYILLNIRVCGNLVLNCNKISKACVWMRTEDESRVSQVLLQNLFC